MTTYIIDTETTGTVEPQPIQLAWLQLDPSWYRKVISKYSEHFLPSKPIEFGAMMVHHLTLEKLSNCAPHTEAKLPDDAEYIIGHNVDYDWKVLGSPPIKRICTQALARYLWPKLDSHRLGALLYFLKPGVAEELLKESHDALTDCYNCLHILKAVADKLSSLHISVSIPEELWQVSEMARIPKIMSFGKHKGEPIEAVPAGYVSWYLKQVDPDPYLVKAFQLAKAARRS